MAESIAPGILPTDEQLDEAICGLRAWRAAGESYARRGGNTLQLDDQVDVALDEIEWRRDAEAAAEDEVERPDDGQLKLALEGIKAESSQNADAFGRDLAFIHAWLSSPAPAN